MGPKTEKSSQGRQELFASAVKLHTADGCRDLLCAESVSDNSKCLLRLQAGARLTASAAAWVGRADAACVKSSLGLLQHLACDALSP